MNISTIVRKFALPVLSGFAMLALPAVSQAQSIYGGLNLLTGFPSGEFKEHVTRTGIGVAANVGYHFDNIPLMIGLAGGVMTYGSEERHEPFSTTIPDVQVRVETDNNIAMGDIFLRLQPAEGVIRPYIDAVAGFNYLFTKTSIQNEGGSNEEVASSTNHDDATFHYGGGGGVLIRVYANEDKGDTWGSEQGPREFFVNVGVRYLTGGEADYLTSGSIRRENSQVSYTLTHSRTDLITGQIGLELRF